MLSLSFEGTVIEMNELFSHVDLTVFNDEHLSTVFSFKWIDDEFSIYKTALNESPAFRSTSIQINIISLDVSGTSNDKNFIMPAELINSPRLLRSVPKY